MDYYIKIWMYNNCYILLYTFDVDLNCWLEHISMNLTSGDHPDGIQLSAVEGLSSVDYFVSGVPIIGNMYYVW